MLAGTNVALFFKGLHVALFSFGESGCRCYLFSESVEPLYC